jgi:ABC-type uncharacterized transport system involved in gliding motility auxiliary subunit
MHNFSKLLFVIAGISGLILAAVYFIVQVWMPILYFFLIAMIGCFGVAILLDFRLYLEFFTLKTTKHGMNMGLIILLMLVGLICVNYLGARYNKTWDLTTEKLYSLSDQTKKIIGGLDHDIDFTIFYKDTSGLQEKQAIQKVADLYKDFSPKVKVRIFNSYTDKAKAIEYLNPLPDHDSAKAFAFIEYGGKRIRVESPFDENQFTGAIVKATRRGEKKIYFLKGHGERNLASDGPDGLLTFKQSLEGQAFKVEELNLMEKSEIPKDADFLAIVGPKTAVLAPELKLLRDYTTKGGRLLIAVDPGERHNLSGFLKEYGVEFMNNYVVSLSRGGYTALAMAVQFSPTSKITEDFQSGKDNVYAVFDLASELRVAASVPNGLKLNEIVKSSPYSLGLTDIKQKIQQADLSRSQAFTLAIEVTGRLDHNADGTVTEKSGEKDKVFEAVVFGDSDFLSNQSILLGVNRDLALNTAADLAHEADLIGARAKSYQGTVLDMGRYQQAGIVLGGIGLPVVLLIFSGVMWFRRRGA